MHKYVYIVSKGVPASPPLRHPALDSACPYFTIFPLPFLSVPPPFKVF